MCTSTRTLISAVSIWPGSTWLTLWLEEATSDDGIPADDVGRGEDGGGGATCTCSCCPCTGWAEELGWLGLGSQVAAAGGVTMGAGDTRLRFATLMQDLGYRAVT